MKCPVCEYGNYSSGKCPSCGTDATNLVRLSELPDIYYNKSIELIKKDKLKDAQEALMAVVGSPPNDADSLILLGKVCAELGDYEKSLLYFNMAVELDNSRTDELKESLKTVERLKQSLTKEKSFYGNSNWESNFKEVINEKNNNVL